MKYVSERMVLFFKKPSFFVLSFIFLANALYSQTIQWGKKFGGTTEESAFGITNDANGNFYVTGYCDGESPFWGEKQPSCFNHDAFAIKFNSDGEMIWINRGGGISTDIGWGINNDQNGNTCIVGTLQGTGVFGNDTLTSNAAKSFFLVKYDSSGNQLWSENQHLGNGSSNGYAVSTNANGDIFITGCFSQGIQLDTNVLVSAGSNDVFLAKYSGEGILQWVKKSGGIGDDEGLGIVTDAEGNCIVTGYYEKTSYFGSDSLMSEGKTDIFVAKYDPNGLLLWLKTFGGKGFDGATAICPDNTGGFYITGYCEDSLQFNNTIFHSPFGLADIVLARFTSDSGNCLWATRAGGHDYDQGYSINADLSGDVYVTGGFRDTALFENNTFYSNGLEDVFVAKYSSTGLLSWVQQYGSTDQDFGYGVVANGPDELFFTGSFKGTIISGDDTLSCSGQNDVFIYKTGANLVGANSEASNSGLELSVYPNPSAGIFNLKIRDDRIKAEEVLVTLFNVLGEIVYQNKKMMNNTFSDSIDISSQARGLFYLKVSGSKMQVVHKVVVE